ncbi:MAG: NifB/NifX family molybdenum-iron cluster-binding protein [Anaerolineae bacterium]
MKVVVSAMQEGLDAEVSPVFGRCPVYVFVDTETMEFESAPNPAMSAPGGAGIQAAQFAVSKGVSGVLTGNVGPNAFNVLQAAGVTMYPVSGGSVREAVEALKSGRLQPVSSATSGMGGGMGRGGGRGMGRGMGGGMGMGTAAWTPPTAPSTTGAKPTPNELSELKGMAQTLKDQLDQVTKRIEDLEKKE